MCECICLWVLSYGGVSNVGVMLVLLMWGLVAVKEFVGGEIRKVDTGECFFF